MKTFKRILGYTKSFRGRIIISVLSSILYVILNSISIWLIGTMLGNIMTNTQSKIIEPNSLNEHLNFLIQNLIGTGSQIEQLKSLCILLIIIFMLKNILLYAGNLIMEYVQNRVITNIRIKLFKHISTLSLSFFNNTKTSELTSILIRDIAGMRVAFSQSLQKLIVEPVSIISYIFLLFIINAKFSIFVLTIIPLSGIFSYYIAQSIRRKYKRASLQSVGILNRIKETLSNIKIVKIFNLEQSENNKFVEENKKYFSLLFKQEKLKNLLTPINETIGLAIGILLIWFGGISVLENQSMASDDFLKFILILFALLQPIRKLSNVNVLFQNGIAASERVFSIFDNHEKIPQDKSAIEIKTLDNKIEFKNVYFKYNNSNKNNILENINVTIKKGETIAIVGESGAGKSTFTELIPRLYDVTSGELIIDSYNVKNLKLKSLRNLIGVVTQHSILFNETIKSNISYVNSQVTEKQILHAIKSSNLDGTINKLENGLDTIIGENGLKLSGGEKQRLSIARAIIKNPDILILDEATASLDSESEKKVHEAIDNVIKHRTVIIIAHRLSTIINADKILVFSKGKIIDQGTHKELIKKDGMYKDLYRLQYNG